MQKQWFWDGVGLGGGRGDGAGMGWRVGGLWGGGRGPEGSIWGSRKGVFKGLGWGAGARVPSGLVPY